MCKKKERSATKTEPTPPQNHQLWGNQCPLFHVLIQTLKKNRLTFLVPAAVPVCRRALEVCRAVCTPPQGPFLVHPPAQHLLHVSPVIEPAQLHQLGHCPLAVAEQELQGGALRPLLQEAQFIIGHAPFAGKIPPVFHCWVTWIQLYPDHI